MRSLLGGVRCPTLVVHSRGDLRVPVDQARELAAAIPDSRLVLLDSRNHLLTAEEPAWPHLLAELDRFLGPIDPTVDVGRHDGGERGDGR